MCRRYLLLICFCLLILSLTACSFNQKEDVISGTIEADELPIVAEVGGTVQAIHMDEGAVIKKNQVIAEIDPESYQIAVTEAESILAQSTAKLDEAKAGSRNQSIEKGAAAVHQQAANIELAEARLKQSQANLARAKEQWSQAEAQMAGAKRTLAYEQSRLHDAEELYNKGALAKRDYDSQKEAVNKASTQVDQLLAQVAVNQTQYQSSAQDVEAAKAQVSTARAQWESASADLDLLQEGSTDYNIRNLSAAEKQARAKLDAAKLQLEKTVISAPVDGVMLRKNITEGEVAKTGATLFTLMKKEKLKLKVYIPEADLGSIRVGQSVGVKVDAYPGETFTGTITAISDKAEFTPRNVQTKDERTKLVFAVTIHVNTGLDKLKPGMPADVLLEGVNH